MRRIPTHVRVRRLAGLLMISACAALFGAALASARTHAGVVTAMGTETCGQQTFPVTEMLTGSSFTISSPGGTSTGTKTGTNITADGSGGRYTITVQSPTTQMVTEVFRGQTCAGSITLTTPLVPPTSPPTAPPTPEPSTEPPPPITPLATSSESSSDLKPLFGGLAAAGGATTLATLFIHDDDKKDDDDDDDDDVGPLRRVRPLLLDPEVTPATPSVEDVPPVAGDSAPPPDEVM
jgi:hypothetical protein